MNFEFLKQIYFVRTRFEFKPAKPVVRLRHENPPELPPFAGSALRGAFGHAFRKRLCWFGAASPDNPCQLSGECGNREKCEYFRLFERSQQHNLSGPNVVKPYILEPPIPPELEAIANATSPVILPFIEIPGQQRVIVNHTPLAVPDGFSVGFTLLGQASALLEPVIDLLRLSPLQIGPHRFVLDRVHEPVFQRLDPSPQEKKVPSQLRVAMVTPCRLRAATKAQRNRQGGSPVATKHSTPVPFCAYSSEAQRNRQGGSPVTTKHSTPVSFCAYLSEEGGDYRLEAADFAGQFWQAALVRAMRVRDQFCSEGGDRLPWIEFPDPAFPMPRIVRTQLYRYHYERLSNRQQKKMDFDGMIGSIWFEGEEGLRKLAPLVEAAEILHIGQKATFGLGMVKAEWGTASPCQAR
jgi:hypothetical protein